MRWTTARRARAGRPHPLHATASSGCATGVTAFTETARSLTSVLPARRIFGSSPIRCQGDVALLYGLTDGQSTFASDGIERGYTTDLIGTEGTVESLGGGLYAMNLGGGTGVQTLTPVPEPRSVMLLASGLLGLAARRRRSDWLTGMLTGSSYASHSRTMDHFSHGLACHQCAAIRTRA